MVQKDKSGWSARASWYDEAGNRKRKLKTGFPTKKAALEWERQYIETHAGRPADADTMTVQQLLAAYIEACRMRGRAANTIRGYEGCTALLNNELGAVPISKLNRIRVEAAYANIAQLTTKKGKPMRRGTIAYAHRVLKAACNYAVESKLMQDNPCAKAILPQETEPFHASVIKPEDARKILEALPEYDEQLYLVVLLCVVYGLRRGEALGLRWADIDFINDTITISGQYTYDGGKKTVWTPKLKTSSSHRVMYLVPYVKDVLQAVRQAFPRDRIVQYVCELDGKLPSPNAITRRWYAFRRQMGYDDVRIHDLRHSAAMMMIHSGADLNTVKNLLGHTKIETTQRYLHEDFDTAAAASKRVIEGIFPNLPAEEKAAEK